MSQQPRPTLGDMELQWHDSKTTTDSIIATIIREYKSNIMRLQQENQILKRNMEDLNKKLEPKKDKKT